MTTMTDQQSALDYRQDAAVIKARRAKNEATARVEKAAATRNEIWSWVHSEDPHKRIEYQVEFPAADLEWQRSMLAEQKAIAALAQATEVALARARPLWEAQYRSDWQPVEQALVELLEKVRQLTATREAANAVGVRLAPFGLDEAMLESYRQYFRRDLGLKDDVS